MVCGTTCVSGEAQIETRIGARSSSYDYLTASLIKLGWYSYGKTITLINS